MSQTFVEHYNRQSLVYTIHSSSVTLAVLRANVVQSNHLFGQLYVVTEVAWVGKAAKDVDNVLLLGEKLFDELLTLLLAELFSRDPHYLLTFLG